jgi:uncharacterized protein
MRGRVRLAAILGVTVIGLAVGASASTSILKNPPHRAARGTVGSSTKRPRLRKLSAAVPGRVSPLTRYRVGGYQTMPQFLTIVVNRVARYWARIFANSGLDGRDSVSYQWIYPGNSVYEPCDRKTGVTNDRTAEYCGIDDTIFISDAFATNIWKGILGQKAGAYQGGAFGVAYVVAHEYGHNVQAELGIKPTQPTVSQFELEADCLAGAFANSEYYASALDPGDVARAISTAELVGDYSFTDASHHGTPAERVAAWKLGYNSGSPQKCIDSFTP